MNEKCFAEVDGKCIALTVKNCKGHKNCTMFKTEEQAEIDRQKAFARLSSLSFDKQEYIAGLYYNGKMPWHQVVKK